jgi:uncharacterized protein YegL
VTTLPTYLLVDTSASLTGDMDTINQALAELIDSLRQDPVLADSVRFALIQFASEAKEVVPLTKIYDLESLPVLLASGGTNYGKALSLVHRLILRDVADLRQAGERIFRPLAFFITDGSPMDPLWRDALQELQATEFRERPTIVALGIGSVDPSVLREIASGKGGAFSVSSTLSTADAIISLFSGLTSMLTSTFKSSVSKAGVEPSIHLSDQWLDLSSIDYIP